MAAEDDRTGAALGVAPLPMNRVAEEAKTLRIGVAARNVRLEQGLIGRHRSYGSANKLDMPACVEGGSCGLSLG
jgi:hypothetical protein